ncbi:MAG: hypothetical protein ABI597_04915 [Gammaproteobacteria bacterium]
MLNEKCGTSDHSQEHLFFKVISWSAILVGALIGIGLSFLLNLFSVAIGLSLVSTTKEGIATLAIGGFIGLLISTIVSMFVAGTAAGYLGRAICVKRNLGVLYGFTTWCLALILTVLLTSQMGQYVTNYSALVTHPTTVLVTPEVDSPKLSVQEKSTVVAVDAQHATNILGMSTFLIFILFFVGALASCFGGHFGMECDAISCKKTCSDQMKP